MRFSLCLAACAVFACVLSAQTAPSTATQEAAEPLDKRAFGVLPNYRLADGNQPFLPISAKKKMYIAWRDSTDFPVYPTAAFFAGIYQLQDQNPSFGQGLKGYAHRLVTAYADQAIGNVMIEGVFPSLFREDPRYFLSGPGHGSAKSRLWYAATRIFVNRTDSGHNSFNFAEFAGNAAMAGIGNVYYPDSRKLRDNIRRFYIGVGTDSLGAIAKEFWPDLKRHLAHK